MLLAIDIGNSNIAFGVHQDKWIDHWRISTVASKTSDEYGVLFRAMLENSQIALKDIDQIIVSSVVPPLTATFQKMTERLFTQKALIMNPSLYTGLDIVIENPKEIGADLVANAVAGFEMFKTNCIVIDFGTALSITVVGKNKQILGVSIAPGLESAVKALFSNTAQLPPVPLEAPPAVIGKNTIHAIQSGIVLGYTGLVESLTDRIKKELNDETTKVVATGGLSSVIASQTPIFDAVAPWLTLDGLRLIAEKNLPLS